MLYQDKEVNNKTILHKNHKKNSEIKLFVVVFPQRKTALNFKDRLHVLALGQ